MKKTERHTSRPTGTVGAAKSRKSTGKTTGGKPAGKKLDAQVTDSFLESPTGENLSLTEIKELIELVSEKQFNEFELERGEFRLRLQRGGGRAVGEAPPAPMAPQVAAAPPSYQPESKTVESVLAEPAVDEKLHLITSPIVGTFYRSPSPTSESFIKLGDAVEVGKTLCIIEAMKLMNEIQSDAMGTVAKIFVENGQPVEYGQPLFGLKV